MSPPPGLPTKYRDHWRRPWTTKARRSGGFRKWLDRNGYLTPHFRLDEARCKDGTPVPSRLRRRARDHAFNLERVRHALGDRPIPITSWYRTEAHNRKVGGASQSKHIEAIATDHPRQWVDARGRRRVLEVLERVFANGGVGIYPGGAVHADTRGTKARWSSWSR